MTEGDTTVTITATARNWMVLRQAHLAAVLALQEAGESGAAWAGSMLGIGFTQAMKNSRPSTENLIGPRDNDVAVTVEMNKYLFSGVFSSLERSYKLTQLEDDKDPLPEPIAASIVQAWLLFKAEAILAEVG